MSSSPADPASFHLDRRLGTWEQVVAAAAAGALDEDHHVELKQDVPATSRDANLELARDLAALSVDGGVFVIGVKDEKGKAGEVVGAVVGGLVDRIHQVAASRIDPPLQLDVTTAPKLGDDQRAVVVVTVPASADAPHMVDQRYWGRGEANKRVLAEPEVRRLHETRRRSGAGFEDRLRALVEHDRDALPELGRLYLLLEPTVAPTQRITDMIAEAGLAQTIIGALNALELRTPVQRSLRCALQQVPHVDGLAVFSSLPGDGAEPYVFVLVRDDSAVHLSAPLVESPRPNTNQPNPSVVVSALLETVHSVVALTAHLAQHHTRYPGTWRIGLMATKLSGVAATTTRTPWENPVPHAGAAEYLHVTTRTTAQMAEQTPEVTGELTRRLLRGLGVENQHLPYTPA